MELPVLVRILLSFLAGAIPFAVVAMWGTGIDITKAGSGNPGFNNVLRVGSRWRAAIVLVGDVSKGYIALTLLSRPGDSATPLWLMGLAAVMGHCWSPFLGFRGGKGVATTVGVLFFLVGKIVAVFPVLYLLLRMFGRRMGWTQEGAISSLITMCVVTALVFALIGAEAGVFASIALIIVALRHTSNLREILAGTGKPTQSQ